MWILWLASCASEPERSAAVPPEGVAALTPPAVAARTPPAVAPTPEVERALPDGAFTRELAPGLEVSAHLPPNIDDPGFSRPDSDLSGVDPRLFVVAIDPARYRLGLWSALDPNQRPHARTALEWATEADLQVAFNPGMYEPDGAATAYARGGVTTQAGVRRNALYRGWFVAEGPAVGARVLDRRPPPGEGTWGPYDALPADVRAELEPYGIAIQSLSILRDGAATYPPRTKQWSELAFGVDRRGWVVVVASRYPYEMREFGARVAALDVGVTDLVHGEGGPEASLVIRAGGVEWVVFGSYETGFFDDSNTVLWPLPTVLGARPR